jgi:hypothetical protein
VEAPELEGLYLYRFELPVFQEEEEEEEEETKGHE